MATHILFNLAYCGFYVLASVNLGAILLGILKLKSVQGVSPVTLTATAFLLGQVGLVVIWTALGLLAVFSRIVIKNILVICFLGGLIFAWPFYRNTLAYFWAKFRIFIREPLIWMIIALLIFLLIGMDGIAAFIFPPHGDAEAFYLPFAKVMTASERLLILPGFEAFSQVGLFGELHFAALISLGSLEAAKLFVWFTALAAAVMLLGIGSKIGLKHHGQLLALAMLFTSSTFFYYISDGKVDLFAAALGLAAYYWVFQFGNVGVESRSVAALIGLFTGMSVVAKISYLLVVLPAVFLLIVWRYFVTSNDAISFRAKLPAIFKLGLHLTFWVMLALIPNVIKNTVLFGQPLAPFLVSAGSLNWLDQTWFAPEVTRRILLTYPFSLVFGQYPLQGGGLSVLLLVLAPFILFLPKSKALFISKSFQLTVAAIGGIVLWNVFRASVFAPRYLLATLLLFIPLVAYAVEAFMQAGVKSRWLSQIALFCVVATLYVSYLERADYVATAKAAFALKGEISCINPRCGVWRSVNTKAAPGDRIFMANYYRFWLRPDLLQCVSNTGEGEKFSLLNSPEDRWEFLFENGFRFVILDEETHLKTIEALDLTRVPDWINVNLIIQEGNNTLLSLESRDPSRQSMYSCQQKDYPAWEVSLSQ